MPTQNRIEGGGKNPIYTCIPGQENRKEQHRIEGGGGEIIYILTMDPIYTCLTGLEEREEPGLGTPTSYKTKGIINFLEKKILKLNQLKLGIQLGPSN